MLKLSYKNNFWYSHTRLQSQIIACLGYYILTIPQTVIPWGCGAWHLLAGHVWAPTLWECHFLNTPLSPWKGKNSFLTWQWSLRRKFFEGRSGRGKVNETCEATERIFYLSPVLVGHLHWSKWKKLRTNKALDTRHWIRIIVLGQSCLENITQTNHLIAIGVEHGFCTRFLSAALLLLFTVCLIQHFF